MRYLELKLKGEIVEGRPDYSLFARKDKTDIKLILDVLAKAKSDRKISALLLKVDRPEMGWARAQNIRSCLLDFRSSGKPVYAFMQSAGNRDYYMASACDIICMPPSGTLNLTGLRAEVTFLKGALDMLGVKAQIERIGEYKSAAEILTRDSMSEKYREEINAILDDLYDQFTAAISEGRKMTIDDAKRRIDGGPFTAREAYECGLVDKLLYEDDLEAELKERLGERKLKRIVWERYRVRERFWARMWHRRRPQIAVIHLLGTIASGESRRGPAQRLISGSETIVSLIRGARENKRVRALVLRVNSLGGSGLASDLIWHELAKTRQQKPVIVSFSDVAASGGYYVGVAANRIVAEPATLTGSIGVISGKLIIREMLAKLGLNRETVSRGRHAEFYSFVRPYTEEEREKLIKQMREFYELDFLRKVADGRNLAEDDIRRVAEGRVWTGRQAKRIGLVDEIGGLERAIELAREAAGLPPEKKFNVVYYVKRRKLRDLIRHDLGLSLASSGRALQLDLPLELLELSSCEDVLALMPYDIKIV